MHVSLHPLAHMARISDLERTLRRIGPVSGPELARLLDVSPATLSRTVRAAGSRVCRMGRTRGAMYALRRSIRDLPDPIPVTREERNGTVARAGTLSPLEHGYHWFEDPRGRGVLYEGTPQFVADMQPQGFLGAAFARWHSDLDLPTRLQDWTDDHRLIALAQRGEDMLGNLVLGEESLERLWRQRQSGVEPTADDMYPQLAREVADRPVGPSVGGEAPKFVAYSQTRQAHVLVKFTSGASDEADQRWRDLLAAEALALETLAEHGLDAPPARILDRGDRRFLEIERYDRCGAYGRVGVLSLAALDAEYVGHGSGWPRVAGALGAQRLVAADDVERIRWLDGFGELIGNTDRHLGNISFFAKSPALPTEGLALAPAYDMLPITFAPAEGRIRPATFQPRPPQARELDIWPSVVEAALDYWERVARAEHVSTAFRDIAAHAGQTLSNNAPCPPETGPR